MSYYRAVRAGEPIKLRARFKDDLDDNAQASGVYVHIYDPNVSSWDFSEAYVVSGVPTYWGEGIYEYIFTPPGIGPDGMWEDNWEGVLTGQTLSGNFTFEVSASGQIVELPESQLWQNNLITVTLASGILASDGTALSEEYVFEFMTTTNPSYTNVRKVLVQAGGFLANVEYDTIQTAILEASLEADALTFSPTGVNTSVFNHARREYVTCLTAATLLNNIGSAYLKSKRLDNLHVEYDTNGIRDSMSRLLDCMDKWQGQLMSGGGAKAVKNPIGVVKGEYDPDRPPVSRMWQSTDSGDVSRRMPLANTSSLPSGHRRNLRTYKKLWW